MADAVVEFFHLFVSTRATLARSFLSCGEDPTADMLGCDDTRCRRSLARQNRVRTDNSTDRMAYVESLDRLSVGCCPCSELSPPRSHPGSGRGHECRSQWLQLVGIIDQPSVSLSLYLNIDVAGKRCEIRSGPALPELPGLLALPGPTHGYHLARSSSRAAGTRFR